MPDLDVSSLQQLSAGRVLKALARHCLAVRVSVSAMGKERAINDAEISLEGQAIPDTIKSPARCRLIPLEISRPLDSIGNSARAAPGRFGTPFPGGSYLVPLGASDGPGPAQQLFEQIAALREEYHQTAIRMKDKWVEHVNHIRDKEPVFYARLQKHLVDADTFVSRHTIELQLMPLGGAPPDLNERVTTELRRIGVSADDAAQVAQKVCTWVDSAAVAGVDSVQQAVGWVQEAQQATSRAVSAAIGRMIAEPFDEFNQAMANLEGMLLKNSIIRGPSVDKLRRAYDKLNGFSFMLPDDLKRRLEAVGGRLQNTPAANISGARNSEAAEGLATFLRGVRQELSGNKVSEDMLASFSRSLELE